MARSATAARSTSQSQQTAPAPEQVVEKKAPEGVVLEASSERKALTSRMKTLEDGQLEVINKINEMIESSAANRTKLDERLDKVEQKVSVTTQVKDSAKKVKDKTKETAKKVEKETRPRRQRAWSFVKREAKPSKPSRPQVKAIIVENLALYGIGVACAQMAPVATMSAISTALFI